MQCARIHCASCACEHSFGSQDALPSLYKKAHNAARAKCISDHLWKLAYLFWCVQIDYWKGIDVLIDVRDVVIMR